MTVRVRVRWPGLAFAFAATAILHPLTAGAHDFWIEPSTFAPNAGDVVRVTLRLGHVPEGVSVVRDASRFKRFEIQGPDGGAPVVGLDGRDPAGVVRPQARGVQLLGYESVPADIELEPRAFEAYLNMEGLQHIVAERARRSERGTNGRERFVRCAKSLISVGGGDKGLDRRLGLTLEIIPIGNPLTSSENVEFELRYNNEPCPDLLVSAVHQDLRIRPSTTRSDSRGRVCLSLDRDGIWVVKAVHMERAPARSGFEWRSFWASLSFQHGSRVPAEPASATGVVTSRPSELQNSDVSRRNRDWVFQLRNPAASKPARTAQHSP